MTQKAQGRDRAKDAGGENYLIKTQQTFAVCSPYTCPTF